jgi:sulfur-carrier protein
MEVNILFFGQLTDIAGSKLVIKDVADTDALTEELTKRYPAFARSKYIVTVDKRVINTNTVLHNNAIVALLPPFSGG